MVLEVLAEALEQGVRTGKRQKRGLAGPTEQAAR
jgi:hypothetical protein